MTRAAALLPLMLMVLFGCSREPVQPHDPTSAPPSASGVSRIGDAIALRGAITPQMARDFLFALRSGRTKTVIVRSGGGDDQSAMTIGWAIHSRRLPLIVQNACMSACAHFIFVAASQRLVRPNSLVMFHNDHASIAAMADDNKSSSTMSYIVSVDKLATEEKEYYHKLGVPIALLLEPQIEIRTQCFVYAHSPSGEVSDVDFKAPYIGWIPRQDLLTNSGILVKGFWPTSLPELERAFSVVFKPNAPIKVLYGGGHSLMSEADLAVKFSQIAQCQDSQ